MNHIKTNNEKGFTLIETLVAILVLSLSIGALLSLAAGGFYSVRYSSNQIVANNLLQESIEYVRNSRDTAAQQGLDWNTWQTNVLSVDTSGNPTGSGTNGCLGQNGCYIDPYTTDPHIKECSRTCPYIVYYPETQFYGYETSYPFNPGSEKFETSFVRTITAVPSTKSADQVVVNVRISWKNGEIARSITQTVLLTNWHQ